MALRSFSFGLKMIKKVHSNLFSETFILRDNYWVLNYLLFRLTAFSNEYFVTFLILNLNMLISTLRLEKKAQKAFREDPSDVEEPDMVYP